MNRYVVHYISVQMRTPVLVGRFHIELPSVPIKPTYNAAPGQDLPTIVNADPSVITLSKWGFVPAWAAGRTGIKPVINARAETVATDDTFIFY